MTGTRNRLLAPILIALTLILSVSASSCSSAPKNFSVWFTALVTVTKSAEPSAAKLFVVARQQSSKADDLALALGKAPAGGLASAEAKAVAHAEDLMGFWEAFTLITAQADSVTNLIPREAIALASAQMSRNADPRAIKYVNELAPRVLKSLTCNVANKLLTELDKIQVAGADLAYDPSVGLTPDTVVAYVEEGNASFKASLIAAGQIVPEYSFNSAKFATAAISKATSWVTAIDGVITAPNLTVQRAYIYYIRLCLA